MEFLQELMGEDRVAYELESLSYKRLAWLSGDQEYYPVWSTTLFEQDQIWRSKFDLRSNEQRCERLAQEAALYLICNAIALEP